MKSATTLELASQLIEQQSVTPQDSNCQALLADRLGEHGFTCLDYSSGEVKNTLYTRGTGEPHLLLLGHTDVVPPGPVSDWDSEPFRATVRNGNLYGRGAADMKGAVAAMVIALEQFASHFSAHIGRVSLLLTSDEEGIAVDGVRAVMPRLIADKLLPDYCLVGEPSSLLSLGDNIRIGRRGSIHGELRFHGQQGHTAYASPTDNPAHRALAALQAIAEEQFDQGDAHFPATLLHFSNVNAGTGAANVTPGVLTAQFNIRNSPLSSEMVLRERIEMLLQQNDCGHYELDWRVSGEPFITPEGALLDAALGAVEQNTGLQARQDTGGGTSDGRFFAAAGVQVIELGLINKTIHQVNECTSVTDLDTLQVIYYDICCRLLVE